MKLPAPSPSMNTATTSDAEWTVLPKTFPNTRTQTTW
jgi:hypothetical protein